MSNTLSVAMVALLFIVACDSGHKNLVGHAPQMDTNAPVNLRFDSPEQAIESLMAAYKSRNLEAIVSAKDFALDARLFWEDLGLPVTEEQKARNAKEIEQLEKVIANSRRQLGDEKFVSRAPAHIIDGLKSKLADYEAQLQKLRG